MAQIRPPPTRTTQGLFPLNKDENDWYRCTEAMNNDEVENCKILAK
jgi:hypothetical protein